MSRVDVETVLGGLKDFQRRTAEWAFQRMFLDQHDPALRFLVADEVGLGKTHVAKGVIAQVINHLGDIGDERHDIVYVCSNAAIARQNLRKLAPAGIEPRDDVGRLTMLPLTRLDREEGAGAGVNLIAITPDTSLKFGRRTGQFKERCLAYAFLRAHWGPEVMTGPARWIFWYGVARDDKSSGDRWLREREREYRGRITGLCPTFAEELDAKDQARRERGRSTLREMFDELVEGLKWKRSFPEHLKYKRGVLIAEVRRVLATVGITGLEPDLVILDEFQRFKDLLNPEPNNFAARLAHQLFDYTEPSGRRTRTLLLSATPYRMYTTADEVDADHYQDFLRTCEFLFDDDERVDRLGGRFTDLRTALTSRDSLPRAKQVCEDISDDLRRVMVRTERLSATPDRDGMLWQSVPSAGLEPDDLRSYLRIGDLADTVGHHEPAEYWKSAPYLVNFMDDYKLKKSVRQAAEDGRLADDGHLDPGPGLLDWEEVEAYRRIDPQNGRLRWLLDDLEAHRAFEMLWVPPSLRYYDTGSVYESPEAADFTKRLIFSGWKVVPKVVSSLVSLEAERHAFAGRNHDYSAKYGRRGGQRLEFRTSKRAAGEARAGEVQGRQRTAAMTSFLLLWPSLSLAELGDPRRLARGGRRHISELLAEVAAQVGDAIAPLVRSAPTGGIVDRRWYWATPLFLDRERHRAAADLLLGPYGYEYWDDDAGPGFKRHLSEARAMADSGVSALGPPPDDLAQVLAEIAVGGPAQCTLRAISATVDLPISHEWSVWNAAWIAERFRRFFNAPEVTGVVVGGRPEDTDGDVGVERYWRAVVQHSVAGNLQAVLDEHCHVLRDWLGHLNLSDEKQRKDAACDIGNKVDEALSLRTSSFRVDTPRRLANGQEFTLEAHRMRSRFAVAFGNQTLDGDDGGVARIEVVSRAFNSPFWPFVLTSTSVGQEGLDFHLWCHAVVHWNLPANPVDLEQREGRVHRYKGHAVRRNLAASLGSRALADGASPGGDLWDRLFELAEAETEGADGAIVPYWVFNGRAKIERHVPVLPFSREQAVLPQLRESLAAYRLAFGQPRQEELIEFLSTDRTDKELLELTASLRIDLSPPVEISTRLGSR